MTHQRNVHSGSRADIRSNGGVGDIAAIYLISSPGLRRVLF